MSTVSAAAATRVSGLASGLDTDSIVEQMMKASNMKVDAVKQQKQILEWKQQFYQEITKSLYDFQQKYFNASSWSDAVSNLSPSYNSDYISVTTSSSASSGNIYVKNILSMATAAKVESSSAVSSDPMISVDTNNLSGLAGKSVVVSLNGIEKQLTFSNKTYTNASDVQAELQSLVNNAFGGGKISVSLNGDQILISASNSTLMLKVPTDGSDASSVLTYDSYASNRVDFNVALSSSSLASSIQENSNIEFKINNTTFNFTSNDTLQEIMTKVNASDAGVKMTYSSLTDKFTLTSAETGAASNITFSDTTGSLMSSLFGTGVKTNGTDAVVTLSPSGATDGSDLVTLTRSTNTFDVNGTTITLKGKALNDAEESINITLAHDTNAMYDKISSFVNDYNALLSQITTKVSEEYDKDYPPLTDSQKEDMSDTEIENWEKKAKTGLLANDLYLNEIASSLRNCFYSVVTKVGESGSSIGTMADIGVSTKNYTDKGKLTIDETKLRTALNSDPDKVAALFTQKSSISFSLYASADQQNTRFNESGIFYRLSDVLSANLNTVGKKGALINLVGSPTATYTGDSDYAKRISDIDDKIEKMEEDLTDEENRYYNKFTAMESAIAQLNQQSSWITSMLSSGN